MANLGDVPGELGGAFPLEQLEDVRAVLGFLGYRSALEVLADSDDLRMRAVSNDIDRMTGELEVGASIARFLDYWVDALAQLAPRAV